MSYTVRYSGSREQKRMAGFSDAMDYLGDRKEKVLKLVNDILHDETTSLRVRRNQCYFALFFAGLRGVPAWAIIRTLWMCKTLSK